MFKIIKSNGRFYSFFCTFTKRVLAYTLAHTTLFKGGVDVRKGLKTNNLNIQQIVPDRALS